MFELKKYVDYHYNKNILKTHKNMVLFIWLNKHYIRKYYKYLLRHDSNKYIVAKLMNLFNLYDFELIKSKLTNVNLYVDHLLFTEDFVSSHISKNVIINGKYLSTEFFKCLLCVYSHHLPPLYLLLNLLTD